MFPLAILSLGFAPPRIELDLTQNTACDSTLGEFSGCLLNVGASGHTAIERPHDLGYKQPANAHNAAHQSVPSYQIYTQRCQVQDSYDTDGTPAVYDNSAGLGRRPECKLPEFKGWDFNDDPTGDTTTNTKNAMTNKVTLRVVHVDYQAFRATSSTPLHSVVHQCTGYACTPAGISASIDWRKRGTYLFKYDLQDKAGNYANQLVFGLVLDDLIAPSITMEDGVRENSCTGISDPDESAIQVEANDRDWTVCGGKCTDNVDGVLSGGIGYRVVQWDDVVDPSSGGTGVEFPSAATPDHASYGEVKDYINTCDVGEYLIKYICADYAGVYGHQQHNNYAIKRLGVMVKDTRKPCIHMQGTLPKYQECGKAYKDIEPVIRDQQDTECGSPYGATINYTATCREKEGNRDQQCWGYKAETGSRAGGDDSNVNYQLVGTHTVKYIAQDSEGQQSSEQCGMSSLPADKQVIIVDTRKPVITLETYSGFTAEYAEIHCNASGTGESTDGVKDTCSFTEPMQALDASNTVDDIGARCYDECLGAYETKYGVPANQQGTEFWVDTEGENFYANTTTHENGDLKMYKHWEREFNSSSPLGTYYITYTCQDREGNNATATRTVVFVDTAKPIIDVIGEGDLTVEATREEDYDDAGAKCYDNIDTDLSHAVMVSGDNVNKRIPGTYNIYYDCRDISGNQAEQRSRTVVIQDTLCPNITMRDNNGAAVVGNYNEIEWEAGQAYIDPGATATDYLDGNISDHVWADGDTINTRNHFRSQPSCRAIYEEQEQFGLEHKDGYYHITRVTSTGDKRVLVWCDMTNKYTPTSGDGNPWYGQTWYAVVCGKRIHNFRSKTDTPPLETDNTCADVGLDVASLYDLGINKTDGSIPADAAAGEPGQDCANGLCGRTKWTSAAVDYGPYESLTNAIGSDPVTRCADAACWNAQSNDYYLCTAKESTNVIHPFQTQYLNPYTGSASVITSDKISVAETGKYVISYHVSDWAGNTECTPKQRTVVVRDTMPPVIQLYVRKHSGAGWKATRQAKPNHWNPAWTTRNPQFQDKADGDLTVPPDHSFGTTPGDSKTFSAERSATGFNGWVVGAIASAVSGIALLSHSLRRSTEEHIDV